MGKKALMGTDNLMPYEQARDQLSIGEKAGQLFMPAAFINDDEDQIRVLELLIQNHTIGGICFFHSRASAATNFDGKLKVLYNEDSLQTLKNLIKRYQVAAPYPLLIAIDAEWGLAMRIENTPQYPYALTLGAIRDNGDIVRRVAEQIALDCREAGIHWNFAPVADINTNPHNPVIGYRSFGEDKTRVAQRANAYISGLRRMGILSSVKHYPGHGDTATDSHLGLPVVAKSREELENNELYPFREAIKNGVDSVMVGHLSVPALTGEQELPASVSRMAISEILRKDMGFEGVVVSDALNMRAVSEMFPEEGELEWQAFNAGNDILCFAENIAQGKQKILERASHAQVEQSFERVWRLKEKALSDKIDVSSEKDLTTEKLNAELAAASLTLFKGEASSFKDSDNQSLIGIEMARSGGHPFFRRIRESRPMEVHSTSSQSLASIETAIRSAGKIVLAVFPPKVKPLHNFEMTSEELDFINKLIHEKEVILYIFGNPFILNLINVKESLAVIIAYQDFPVFQENAALHLLGEITARGELPVTIAQEE